MTTSRFPPLPRCTRARPAARGAAPGSRPSKQPGGSKCAKPFLVCGIRPPQKKAPGSEKGPTVRVIHTAPVETQIQKDAAWGTCPLNCQKIGQLLQEDTLDFEYCSLLGFIFELIKCIHCIVGSLHRTNTMTWCSSLPQTCSSLFVQTLSFA